MSEPDQSHPTHDEPDSDGDRYERLVASLSKHAIFEIDLSGTFVTWSEPARQLYGRDADSVLGENLQTLFAADAELERPLPELLEDAKANTLTTDQWHRHADGSVFWGTLTLEPLREGESDAVSGFTVVSQDTTDRRQYEQMLERQNDRLKEFTDILAHDLRSPLNVIDGHVEQFEQTGDRSQIEAIAETTDRMERLVDDLLEVARQGNVVTDPQPTDIGVIVDTAWAGIHPDTVTATLEYEPVGKVSADGDRLCELFENLFRNAVEHTGDDVVVTVTPMPGGIAVEDDGPGIDQNMRESVFDHGVSTNDDGSGYGLSIVRTIANAHGWDVVVTDSDSGGARFEITGIDPVE